MVPHADQNEASPFLRGCDLRNCRNFRGLRGGPAEWCPTQIRMRPRRPRGAAICETVATFEGCRWAQRSEAPPQIHTRPRHPWGAAICEAVATFVSSLEGQHSGVLRTPIARRPWGGRGWGCDQRSCRHFRGLLRGPAEWCPTQTTTISRRPLGGLRSANLSPLSWAPGGPLGRRARFFGSRSLPWAPLGAFLGQF